MMDNVLDENMDISKLKVPDLKRELKARGLSTSGNKNELMERLQTALKNKTDDSAGAESVDDLEEDLLNVDDDEHLDGSESGITDIDSAMDIPHGQRSLKRKSQEITHNDQPKHSKKVVLNRTPSNTDVIHSSPSDSISDGKIEEKKVIKFSDLSAKERLEMRAKKFGVPLTVDAKKAARAERFGMGNSTTDKSVTTTSSTNVDLLKQRAERFGINVSSVITKLDNEERLKRRQERFGVVVNGTQNVKAKQQRLQRFRRTV